MKRNYEWIVAIAAVLWISAGTAGAVERSTWGKIKQRSTQQKAAGKTIAGTTNQFAGRIANLNGSLKRSGKTLELSWVRCQRECEESFAQQAAAVVAKYQQAYYTYEQWKRYKDLDFPNIPNPYASYLNLYYQLRAEALQMHQAAYDELRRCLEACPFPAYYGETYIDDVLHRLNREQILAPVRQATGYDITILWQLHTGEFDPSNLF